jgi:hypothetical protein
MLRNPDTFTAEAKKGVSRVDSLKDFQGHESIASCDSPPSPVDFPMEKSNITGVLSPFENCHV